MNRLFIYVGLVVGSELLLLGRRLLLLGQKCCRCSSWDLNFWREISKLPATSGDALITATFRAGFTEFQAKSGADVPIMTYLISACSRLQSALELDGSSWPINHPDNDVSIASQVNKVRASDV